MKGHCSFVETQDIAEAENASLLHNPDSVNSLYSVVSAVKINSLPCLKVDLPCSADAHISELEGKAYLRR